MADDGRYSVEHGVKFGDLEISLFCDIDHIEYFAVSNPLEPIHQKIIFLVFVLLHYIIQYIFILILFGNHLNWPFPNIRKYVDKISCLLTNNLIIETYFKSNWELVIHDDKGYG